MEATNTEALERTQFLTFVLADEEYALSIHRTREIIEYPAITAVPGTPRFIRGVLNLRGSVVPVVDLGAKFGLPAASVTKRTCVVIVEVRLGADDVVMGVIADAVSQVVELSETDIEPPPRFGTTIRVDYVRAMGKVGDRFVLLLDIDKVLSQDEIQEATGVETGSDESADAPAAPVQADAHAEPATLAAAR